MAQSYETIRKSFSVETENLLSFPKHYDESRTWPLVVALHGMGMTAPEFAGLLAPLRSLPTLLFVPEGVHPYEIRSGEQRRIGRAWYLYTGDDDAFVRSMEKSGRHLEALVARVGKSHPVDRSKVFLLGFSQGGYFAGYWAVRHSRRFCGAVVVGARVKDEVLERQMRRPGDLKLLLLHGRKDRAVPFAYAERSFAALESAGFEVTLKAYEQGHILSPDQLRDARAWLKSRL